MFVAELPLFAAGLLAPVVVAWLVLVLVLPLMLVALLPFCAAGLLVPPEVLVLTLVLAVAVLLLVAPATAPGDPAVPAFCASAAPVVRASTAQLARRSFLIPYSLFLSRRCGGSPSRDSVSRFAARRRRRPPSARLEPPYATNTRAIRVPSLPLPKRRFSNGANNDF